MLPVATGCPSRVAGLNWNLNEPLVPGSQTISLCSNPTEPAFSSDIFGRVDEAFASHGRVVRAHKNQGQEVLEESERLLTSSSGILMKARLGM